MATTNLPAATPSALEVEDLAAEPVRIPASAKTLDGFVAWATSDSCPRRGRISFLGGEIIVDMAAEEIQSHSKLKQRIGTALDRFVTEGDIGEVLADGALFKSERADVSHEPDLVVCLFESLTAGRVRYVESVPGSGRDMVVAGSPDLVVEVVSASSVRKDTVDLRGRYFLAGVREYWIVDARGMRLTFHLLSRGEGDWHEAVPDADGFRRSPALQARVRLDRGVNRVGTPRYDLSIES